MSNKKLEKILIPQDKIIPINRLSDKSVFLLHCTGGFRAQEVDDNKWMVAPIWENGIAVQKGFVTRTELETLYQSAGFRAIAFESINMLNGRYHSSWSPIIPDESNHLVGPADLWGCIASNLSSERADDRRNNLNEYNEEQSAEFLVNTTKEESLARHISSSLCSMDLSIQRLVEYYNEQVINFLNSDNISKTSLGNAFRDKVLYTHVHSFFLHLGAARDYLGAFLAHELGMKNKTIDDMRKLTNKLGDGSFSSSPILQHMQNEGLFESKPDKEGDWKTSGWLKEVSVIRNQFVHKRPYGSKYLESLGKLMPVDEEVGLYQYVRPFILKTGETRDLLNELAFYYRKCMKLFFDAANLSNLDTSLPIINDDVTISKEVKKI